MRRSKFLRQGHCYERITIRNFALEAFEVAFSIHFDADFVDIFEVRGTQRQQRGSRLPRGGGVQPCDAGLPRTRRRRALGGVHL